MLNIKRSSPYLMGIAMLFTIAITPLLKTEEPMQVSAKTMLASDSSVIRDF